MESLDLEPDLEKRAEGEHRELQMVVEALIFVADESITPDRIAEVYVQVTGGNRPSSTELEATVDALNDSFHHSGRAVQIQRWAGGYRMTSTEAVAPYIKAYFRKDRRRRLSRSLMETLAILAYRQPVTKPEIDFVRGVDADYAIRRLLEIGFVDVVGRSESVGRPLLYGTTTQFLEAFGLTNIEEMPNLREVAELLNDPAFNAEKARLLMLKGLETDSSSRQGIMEVSDS